MILAATGLRAEAHAIARPGVEVIACGGHGDELRRRLGAAIAARRPAGLLSIGLAGGLDPALTIGRIVIGRGVDDTPCDPDWLARLAVANPLAVAGTIAGADAAVATAAAKAALHTATGAIAVDMESACLACVATAHRLPFAILRVIGDTAAETLPAAARVPLGEDGSVRLRAVLAAVARRPGDIPALIRLARRTGIAMAVLGALDLGLTGLSTH